ncbi:MAG: metal ABC transporter ATP-binding protein [Oscillospiraceae bacterium]|jgi:zinc transport system ATP-binding protein|nr:metal ABC transporter ATP-binding protein [Oscillospiraceae bacterium]
MALITCETAAFGYEGGTAVRDVNFALHGGEYLCVLGENGSGKSTLLKGILRLKSPQSGRVILGDGLRQREIGYLPQQTVVQKDFPAGAFEVVLSGCLGARGIRPFYTRKDRQQAEQSLRLLDGWELRNRCYRELSGGQQQRVLLARALCATKRLLLLDEPAAGLDPIVTQELYQLIQRINCERGVTILMVSHDVNAAVQHASHILHLQGRQLFFGTVRDYAQTQVGKRFLGEGVNAE